MAPPASSSHVAVTQTIQSAVKLHMSQASVPSAEAIRSRAAMRHDVMTQ